MKKGDRVRVKESVTIYHQPGLRGKPANIEGLEGIVDKIVTEWEGRPVSANLPILVKFDGKFRAHLREDELELIDD
jgi:hypothetical protein